MSWDVDKAVTHLQKHAKQKSLGRCAQYTREAIEAGGVVLARHESAKDYGLSLLAAGFTELHPDVAGELQKGDVAIIQGFTGHPHGHMAMYDGKCWISDFVQRSLYPGDSYRKARPSYKIYRYRLLWTGPDKVTTRFA
jgi:hypothetical protein